MESAFSELHQFYVDVVNYPMQQRLVESRDGGRVDELYNFLPVERRAELKMIPDAMDNILARLAVDESYINAPTVFISEKNPDLATRANWVQFLVTNRLILSGGVVRDLPQLVGLQDYDRVASTALVMIASVYICSVYKCAETRVSVCDHALTLAAAQLDGLFPPAFDRFVRDCCKSHSRENVASSDAPYTYDCSLTWSTEVMGFKFRDTFLKALFECDRGDNDAVMIRLKVMEKAVREVLGDNPSISRGFVWTQLCVVNVRIAVDALFRYGPRSRAFKPSRDDGVYTDLDMARMFFDVADGCGVHSPHDGMRYFNAPYSPKDGDALPACPICLETTHYCNINFVENHDSVVLPSASTSREEWIWSPGTTNTPSCTSPAVDSAVPRMCADDPSSVALTAVRTPLCAYADTSSCKYNMRDFVQLDATLDMLDCSGTWSAPLWTIPDVWDGSGGSGNSGEVDLVEQCPTDRLCANFAGAQFPAQNAREKCYAASTHHPNNFHGHVTMRKSLAGRVTVSICAGETSCDEANPAFYGNIYESNACAARSAAVNAGNCVYHLMTDLWLGASGDAGYRGCSEETYDPNSKCGFSMTRIRINTTTPAVRFTGKCAVLNPTEQDFQSRYVASATVNMKV
ncbi:hypothetical protein CYMTET_46559 [Cymbomonas tetramitiformis]|uniref:Uncharacterized protein n=1 Tax=Cymbomonas tetramitiformis TaxID=36881 RepID=A0AAE0EXH0_9CHLO|nr:hypothetical protein CYMTET_46559 [Cymbomonas tetramitiformis]